ncbi:MAG: type II toxin-antitoxin system mRNA interferase toxin, RelE/StbE family [Phormidesmis priestleyi]|uniref:Type II toxin-antitoxin system mRNA interferase toxin, RelE/StbE family n=1 Tax=Phormidesmis priestleyi TaxID=268141 RepID=A0A2W4ZEL0_9CYAN|nr:MAG: type II toxin-antitoxin system mRNA interferase toxin, RelE/StbE family [Phormidesmis priestleyi]
MTYSLEFVPEAVADLQALAPSIQDRILRKVQWFADNFEATAPMALVGNLSGLFKLRVGDYRVLYSFDVETKHLTIQQIGHRRNIYS